MTSHKLRLLFAPFVFLDRLWVRTVGRFVAYACAKIDAQRLEEAQVSTGGPFEEGALVEVVESSRCEECSKKTPVGKRFRVKRFTDEAQSSGEWVLWGEKKGDGLDFVCAPGLLLRRVS